MIQASPLLVSYQRRGVRWICDSWFKYM